MTPPPSIVATPRRYRRDELLAAAGAAPQLLNDAISTGMLTPSDMYGEHAVTLLRSMVALDRHGIEPRHLRALKQSAEREVALVESALRLAAAPDRRGVPRQRERAGTRAGASGWTTCGRAS